MTDIVQAGRIAFRSEGLWWNAYYAMPDTMEGALHLGSIRLTAAQADPKVKDLFIQTMRAVVDSAFTEKLGVTATWNEPAAAPEHERAGRA